MRPFFLLALETEVHTCTLGCEPLFTTHLPRCDETHQSINRSIDDFIDEPTLFPLCHCCCCGCVARPRKVKVHYEMKVVGGENIASSGEDRSKPFEFRLVGQTKGCCCAPPRPPSSRLSDD